MIVKIFKTIGLISYLTFIFFVFSSVSFSFFCNNADSSFQNDWYRILINMFLIVSYSSIFTLQKIQIKGRKFDGIHLIAFPIIFLFFPNLFLIKTILILQSILLIYGQFVFIKILHSKNTGKWIFDLSIIISLLAQFNLIFYVFYFLLLFIFFKRGLKDAKNLLALLLPVFMMPFIFNSLSVVLPPETFAFVNPPMQFNLLDPLTLPNEETVWLITLLISVLICLVQIPRVYIKFSYPKLFSGFFYMTFWLLFGLFYGLFGLNTTENRWFFSFIPGAYFFGSFLENIKSDAMKNTVFSLLLLSIIVFKLLNHGIISLELPF